MRGWSLFAVLTLAAMLPSLQCAGSTPDETAAYFRLEVERYARVVKAANMQVD